MRQIDVCANAAGPAHQLVLRHAAGEDRIDEVAVSALLGFADRLGLGHLQGASGGAMLNHQLVQGVNVAGRTDDREVAAGHALGNNRAYQPREAAGRAIDQPAGEGGGLAAVAQAIGNWLIELMASSTAGQTGFMLAAMACANGRRRLSCTTTVLPVRSAMARARPSEASAFERAAGERLRNHRAALNEIRLAVDDKLEGLLLDVAQGSAGGQLENGQVAGRGHLGAGRHGDTGQAERRPGGQLAAGGRGAA